MKKILTAVVVTLAAMSFTATVFAGDITRLVASADSAAVSSPSGDAEKEAQAVKARVKTEKAKTAAEVKTEKAKVKAEAKRAKANAKAEAKANKAKAKSDAKAAKIKAEADADAAKAAAAPAK